MLEILRVFRVQGILHTIKTVFWPKIAFAYHENESYSKKRTRIGSAKVVLKKMFKPEFFSTKKLNHSSNLSVNDVLLESDDVFKFHDIQHPDWKELAASIGGE